MLWLQVSGVWAGRRQLRSISDARRVALQCGWLLGSASKSSHVVPSTAWALTAYASPPSPTPFGFFAIVLSWVRFLRRLCAPPSL